MSKGLTLSRRQGMWLAVVIVLLGSGLRIPALEQSPPGLAPDEASNAYDAYSLWHTGRDQHGVLLPAAMRALNDYRMPLFMYSQAPLVGMGGLSVMNARLAAAFWGILSLAAVYWLGSMMFGRPTGVAAALLLAVSPWQVPLSRIALEGITTVLMALLTVGFFWRWQRTPKLRWLAAAAAAAGFGLYTYSVMKLFLPTMAGILAVIFRRKIVKHWRQAIVAVSIGGVLAAPMLYNTLRYPDAMQARYRQIAVFRPERPMLEAAQEVVHNAWHNLSPDFLFGRGDLDALQHPPGLGQLYPVQALLILLGIAWGFRKRRHRQPTAIALLWILAAVIPAALTQPNLPNSGHALRTLEGVAPWQLLSGLGLVGWLTYLKERWLRWTFLLLVVALVAIPALSYFGYYFTAYPSEYGHRFDVEMKKVVTTMDRMDDGHEVYFTCQSNWPYLYVLFFTRYDPHLLQTDPPVREEGLFAPVSRLGRYHFICNTEELWEQGERGLFVTPASELPDVTPLAIISRSDGEPLYKIIERQ